MAARAPPSGAVDRAIADLSPELRPIAEALRRMIHAAAPGLRESVKWGNPVWVGRQNVICLMLFTRHVNLGFFSGAILTSRFPELEGTGKGMRHVKVRNLAEARRAGLSKLVRAAANLDATGR